jgi:SAM-dependent methyltransferase
MFHKNGPTLLELAEQALTSTDRGYDLLAPKFDFTPFRTPDDILRVAAEHARTAGPIDRALDLGCGTGAAMTWMRPVCTGVVVGLDRSAGMLQQAREKLAETRGARVVLVRGDLLAPPFAAEFDVVTCFGAFGHVLPRDEPRLARAVRSVLRPGGRFIFATGDAPPLTSPALWAARGFNGVMQVRNLLWKPEFVMYYLTFLRERATQLLEAHDFSVEVRRDVYPAPFRGLYLIVATRRS